MRPDQAQTEMFFPEYALGLISNRLRNAGERFHVSVPSGLSISGWVPEDDTSRSFDIAGKSVLEIPPCPAVRAIEDCLAVVL